jgi:pilus assembly protein Flp/PilA
MLTRFFEEEEGQTLIEYGLLISLLALVVVAAVTLFGKKTRSMWGDNASKYPDPPP